MNLLTEEERYPLDKYYQYRTERTLKNGERKEYIIYQRKNLTKNPKRRGRKYLLKTRLIDYIKKLDEGAILDLCEKIDYAFNGIFMDYIEEEKKFRSKE